VGGFEAAFATAGSIIEPPAAADSFVNSRRSIE